jgi:hypothetical protein
MVTQDNASRLGLGRIAMEQALVNAETATRRQLTVEEQLLESAEQRVQRLQRVEERSRVEQEVADMNRKFFCEARHQFESGA